MIDVAVKILTIGDVVEQKIPQGIPNGQTTFTYVDISSIDNRLKRIVEPKEVPIDEAPSRARQQLHKGDVVVSMTRPNLNAVALVTDEYSDAIGSTGFCVLRPRGVVPQWLYYRVQTMDFIHAMDSLVQGALYPAVRKKDVYAFPITVPNMEEQQQIVDEIETQLARLDDAVASLQRARARLKHYRASVLKAACEGRLVPIEAELARQEGRDYEPASILLDRIKAERQASCNGKLRKTKKIVPLNMSTLPELPEGWSWTSFGNCFDVYVGATPSRKVSSYWNGDIPWVSSGEVAFCRIRETRETITEMGLSNSSTRLHPPGTVLLGMIGEGRTRGQVAMLDIEASNNQNSAAIRVSATEVEPWYVYHYLEGRYQETRLGSSGNNQPALNKSRVEAIPLPLPPACEQARIVEELDRRLSIVDQLDELSDNNLKRAEALRQSILRNAFYGQLVSSYAREESQQS